GWTRRISSLKARTSNLDQRLRALPQEGPGSPTAKSAQRRRLAALVTGSRESLFDLDRNVEQSVREVEEPIGRGDDQGERALTAAAEAIDGYVRDQEQSVAAAEAAVIGMEEVGTHGQARTASISQ